MNLRLKRDQFTSLIHAKGGLSYFKIFQYFYPEYISALILYFLPYCIDCLFICQLQSVQSYAISGIIDNFFTMFLKSSEGLSVATVILVGYFNGLKDFKKAGQSFVDAFWVIVIVGFVVAVTLYFLVFKICNFNQFSPEMIEIGLPYLQYKSISVFFMFVYFALVGFLRSIKNTFVPMVVFALGAVIFVFVDYALIFGAFGLPELCLVGSAIASIVQYVCMSCFMLGYILFTIKHEKYAIKLFSFNFDWCRIQQFFLLALPVVLDKVSISFAYAWLGSYMSSFGAAAGAGFSCIKMMERFAFVPAIACAQVITFLVSNDVGLGKWDDINANIKRILWIALFFVGTILVIASIWPLWFVQFFDKRQEFGYLVATIFPMLSVLILIDLVQLILSAALRGAGDVKTVMITRVGVIGFYFIPATYVIARLPFEQMVYKMLAVYSAFLFGNALMSIVYVVRLRQSYWKKQKEKACNG